jgi:glycine/D-amino acid oxidase-like deaminating enzyme
MTADVVVIGAGFTGLSTALHLRRQGIDVAVIEAAEPGWGASGRNNGQVIPTLSRAEPDELARRFGPAGERFAGLIRDSAGYLFDLVRAEAIIEAEAEQSGWIQPVHTPGRMKVAERRVKAWSAIGAPATLLDRAEMARRLGSEAWFGGWTNPTGGHINPLGLARGLARVAAAQGARIFANSPVTEIVRQGDTWQVTTAAGRLRSRGLVLATNAYTGEFSRRLAPDVAREVVPYYSWQLATAPLSDNVRRSVLPGREAMSDTHAELYFARFDARHRLVTGGALLHPINGRARLEALVAPRLERLFPQIGKVTFDYVWNGYVGMTADYTPRFHRLGPDAFTWAGCNGRGVALSIILGRELARAVTGTPEQELAMPFTEPAPLPMHGIVRRVAPAMLLVYRRRDSREV